ncbi:MAG: hypothetical protein QN157_06990 [Armatimonadota bacterium]|nr:hypothetical protein [Armatimonadota bacterium]
MVIAAYAVVLIADYSSGPPRESLLLVGMAGINFAIATLIWRRTRDPLHPGLLVIALLMIRYWFPYALVRWLHVEAPVLVLLGIGPEEFLRGLGLTAVAATSFLLILVGELTGRRNRAKAPVRTEHELNLAFSMLGIPIWLAYWLGAASLALFVVTNTGDLVGTALSGAFRGATIQEGSGIWFYTSLLMIAAVGMITWKGSVTHPLRLRSLTPAFWAAILFLVLGGRSRALTPVAIAILIWQMERQRWPAKRLKLPAAGPGFVSLLLLATSAVVVFAGALYRGGGIGALTSAGAWSAYIRELGYLMVVDLGQLHGPAAAAAHESKVLGPGPILGALLWPISEFVDVGGRSPGVFLAMSRGLVRERPWGFHAGIAGAGYLTLGIGGTVVLAAGLGFIAARAYEAAKTSIPVLPSIVMWYVIRIFFEGIEKWGEMIVVVGMAGVLLWVGKATRLRAVG